MGTLQSSEMFVYFFAAVILLTGAAESSLAALSVPGDAKRYGLQAEGS